VHGVTRKLLELLLPVVGGTSTGTCTKYGSSTGYQLPVIVLRTSTDFTRNSLSIKPHVPGTMSTLVRCISTGTSRPELCTLVEHRSHLLLRVPGTCTCPDRLGTIIFQF
jgi:hypothetical protein